MQPKTIPIFISPETGGYGTILMIWLRKVGRATDIQMSGPSGMKAKIGILVAGLVLLTGGCFTPDPKSLDSDRATSAIPAIKDAADQNNRQAIPRLIVLLDDNDSAIRFAAINALEKMTGQTFDYHYYDDIPDRQPAIQRWQHWLAEHPNS
jgi:hypothetical protein